jgi:LacI family transcriptional regulator
MKSRPTLKEIAKELQVSISTVSKALHDSYEIGEKTKSRIKEYAESRNYRPNIYGINLKNRTTKTIGVIIPNILNSFYAKVFSGIEKIANQNGYKVITCISNESLVKEKDTLEMLSNGSIDGFIISVSEEAQKKQDFKHLKQVITEGTPMVMFDRVAQGIACDKVIIDDFESGVNTTQSFIDMGRKNIALVSSINHLSVGQLRAEGYFKALKNNNIEVNQKLIVKCENESEMQEKLHLLFKETAVDAIFALDEDAAVNALKMAIKNELKIPEQIAIVGFADGVLASRKLTPRLSTISQNGVEMGEKAAQLLINKLKKSPGETNEFETIIIKTKLKERESSKK